jgi:hypothetical protein
MELEGIVFSAGITVLALGLLFISVTSYRKYRNPKLLFISLVFVVLLIKGILFNLHVFFEEFPLVNTLLFTIYGGIFDFMILLLLFMATVKR